MEGIIPATGFARSERVAMRHEVDELVLRAYRVHYVEVARLALLLVGDPDLAEDLSHQAFTRLHLRWDHVKDEAQALPFLHAALVKLARARRRRPASAPRRSSTQDPHQRVVDALARLPERQRAAIVLRDYVHLSERDIAAAMGSRPRAVRAHLERANASLSTALGADR
jgi:RNA polymerase sigma factor (sigma-70 family)